MCSAAWLCPPPGLSLLYLTRGVKVHPATRRWRGREKTSEDCCLDPADLYTGRTFCCKDRPVGESSQSRVVAERGSCCFSLELAQAGPRALHCWAQDQTILHLNSAIFRISLSFLGHTPLYYKSRVLPALCYWILLRSNNRTYGIVIWKLLSSIFIRRVCFFNY